MNRLTLKTRLKWKHQPPLHIRRLAKLYVMSVLYTRRTSCWIHKNFYKNAFSIFSGSCGLAVCLSTLHKFFCIYCKRFIQFVSIIIKIPF